MVFPPWRKLKDTEMLILSQLQDGVTVAQSDIDALRELFSECDAAEDATDAICYHGAAAILANVDVSRYISMKHGETEIRKIQKLHVEERRNPTDGYATQNYTADDLQLRIKLLKQLKNAG